MNSNDNVYHALASPSPCDDHEIIEVFNTEEVVEINASYMFVTRYAIFHYA
jgi:hypothetical protein